MAESVNVSGPIKVVSDSTARVAYELMRDIADREYEATPEAQRKSREYWLTLFHQCMKAAQGTKTLSNILQRD